MKTVTSVERVEMIDELLSVQRHLREALKRVQKLENPMVTALIQEALEEVETALDQIPGASGPDPA